MRALMREESGVVGRPEGAVEVAEQNYRKPAI